MFDKSTHRRYCIPTGDLVQIARGFLMGGADIIPGVSGGTVALILGIYDRLVTAVSHFDLKMLKCLRQKHWTAAAAHIDLRFLISLGSGIAAGILGLAQLMHYLLEHHTQHTFAVFFGLILASSLLVARMVQCWRAVETFCIATGTLFAFWLVGLPLLQIPPEGNLYVFVCGLVAICAMILPGISGSFILLILGKYSEITGLLRNILHGEITLDTLLTLSIFASGCVIGLVSFSKALRWLLARHEAQTMALLCGFMLGSLRKIWPFIVDLTPNAEFKLKQFEQVWPPAIDATVIASLALMAGAFSLVVLLDWLTKAHERVPPLEAEDHEPVVNVAAVARQKADCQNDA